MILLTAGLLVHLVVFSFFPNGIQPALAASSFTVDSLNDFPDAIIGDGNCADAFGNCTLRAAIEETNADVSGAPHNINFNLSGMIAVGPATAIPLPALSNNDTNINVPTGFTITLNGTRFIAAGSGLEVNANNCDIGADDFGGLRIIFFPQDGIAIHGDDTVVNNTWIGTAFGGTSEPNFQMGISASAGANNLTFTNNLISGNAVSGVWSNATGNISINNNFIGVNNTGNGDLGNGAHGVYLDNGTLDAHDNVISGNGDAGIDINGGTNHDVYDNYLGTDLTGSIAISNESGVDIEGGTNILIGNSGRNIISGNTQHGVEINGGTGISVQNNYIGVDNSAIFDLGNTQHGIYSNAPAPALNISANVISGNDDMGIYVWSDDSVAISNNYIGTNTLDANLGNGLEGIRVRGVTPATGAADINNNTVGYNGTIGVYIELTSGSKVNLNTIHDNTTNGAQTLGSNSITYQGNTVYNNGNDGMAPGGCTGTNLIGGNSAIPAERNVIYGNGNRGINTAACGGTTIEGNYIGVEADGVTANGNFVGVMSGAGVQVGNPGRPNVISGNSQRGIQAISNSTIHSNYIGTDFTGTVAVGNGTGVYLTGFGGAQVGGAAANERNIISGNARGVEVNADNSTIENNYIGTDPTGANDLGNTMSGVYSNSFVSGLDLKDNVISGNTTEGIWLSNISGTIQDNYVGTNAAGNAAIANDSWGIRVDNMTSMTIDNNVISGNGNDGISANNSSGVEIYDNHIGVNAVGDAAIPNGDVGVYPTVCTNCTIGAPGQGNVISGNTNENIHIDSCSGIIIQSNMIGTNAAGDAAIAGNADGIINFGSPGTQIGGTFANERNVISGNLVGIGLWLSPNTDIANNFIGVAADGTTPIANSISGISIAEDSDSTTIKGNIIANSGLGVGIGAAFGGTVSKYVSIEENSIYSNLIQGGILLTDGANENIQPPGIYEEEYDPVTDTYDVHVNTPYSGAVVELFTDSNGEGKNYKGNKTTSSPVVFNNITKNPGTEFTVTVTNANGSTSIFGGPDSSAPMTTAVPGGGNYLTPLTVTLDSKDDYDPSPIIYYTTDGSEPTLASDSCVSMCNLDIITTTTLKFFGRDGSGNQEATHTEQYNISSSPSGISLKISNVAAQNVGSTHADIVWDTNKYSDSKVYYGKTVAMVKSKSNASYVLDHLINLTGLDPNTTYYFQVESSTATETAASAIGTFTTFKNEIDEPVITAPADGSHYFTLYMTHNDYNIEVEMQNPVLTEGKNKVYVDGKKQKNKINNKKFAEIGSDGKSEFDIGVKNNSDVAINDGHKIEADAMNTNGNTSKLSEPVSFAMGSTHSSGTISFAPTVAERPADMVNTTLISQPTIASYFPGITGAQVLIYKKSTADSDYVLDGTTNASGDPSGIMNFSYQFYLPQPPGTISVYFKVKDNNGVVQYTSEAFSLVYYKGCPATWQGAVVDIQTTNEKPWLTFLMCHTQEYEMFIDGTFNGSGTAPATPSGTASIAYLPFLPLSEGQHAVKIRTFESYGYPYSDTNATFEVAAGGFGGGGGTMTPPTPTPTPEPEPEPEPDITEEIIIIEDGEEIIAIEEIEFDTEEVVELTKKEKAQLKKELTESLEKNTRVIINIGGVLYEGELIDGLTKFCIKKCLYPSLTADQDMIELSGELDISKELSKKLDKAGAQANTQLVLGDQVHVAKVNRTGEWTITVPLSELPEGEVDARVMASTNGVDSDEVTVAKFQAQTEPTISNTSILIFVNLALAVVFLLIGGIVYQRRRRQA